MSSAKARFAPRSDNAHLCVATGRQAEPFNFRAGLRIQTLVETIHASSRAGAWQDVR
jgi:hypothetical protein